MYKQIIIYSDKIEIYRIWFGIIVTVTTKPNPNYVLNYSYDNELKMIYNELK